MIRFEILEKIKKSLQFIYKFTFLTHHMHYFVQCLRERKRLEGRVRKQSGEQSLAGSFWTTQQPETDIAPDRQIDRWPPPMATHFGFLGGLQQKRSYYSSFGRSTAQPGSLPSYAHGIFMS